MSSRIVDLSHPIESGMTTYPGLPGPVITDYLSRDASRERYAEGTTFQIGRIEMIANTGTYVDAPFHRYADAMDIAGLPLDRLADVEGVVAEARGSARPIGPGVFEGLDLRHRAVLVRTGWASRFGTPEYGKGHPFLTRAAAEKLVSAGPALVGIDSTNIDDAQDGARPVHTLLLAVGIPIIEHLRNLENLPREGFRLHAAPAPFRGVGSFPVRAYAIVD
jgi:kynurenine formamidase